MRKQLAILTGIALLAVVGVGYAHHPFAAEYDWTKPVTFTGTVTKLNWMNPHVSLQVDAKDDSGEMKHWTLEMGSLAALTRAGWTKNTVKMGDTVTVEGWLSRSDKNKANVKSVKLANGKELSGASSIGEIKPESNKPVSN
jgi:hypothetical protein